MTDSAADRLGRSKEFSVQPARFETRETFSRNDWF